jgi:hypothetical protein
LYIFFANQAPAWTPTKGVVLNFFIFFCIAAIYFRQLSFEGVAVRILAALFLLNSIGTVAWVKCKSAGYLDPVTDADLDVGDALERGAPGSGVESKRRNAISEGASPHSVSTRGSPGSKASGDTGFSFSTRGSQDM